MFVKHYQKVWKWAEHSVYKSTTCDMCGEEMERGDFENVRDVRMSHRHGKNYGSDGGWGTQLELDICEQCWCEEILPWLREQGVIREYEKYDF